MNKKNKRIHNFADKFQLVANEIKEKQAGEHTL